MLWAGAQWTPEVPSNLNYCLVLWRGSLYLELSVPGSLQHPVGVFLLAVAMGYGMRQEKVSAHEVEDKFLSVFLLVPQSCKLLILIWNFNTHTISSFHDIPWQHRLLFAWAFRFVLRERHMCHMFLFSIIFVLLHWEWLILAWSLENNCQNKSRQWRVCLCLPFSHCCNVKSTKSLADELKGACLHTQKLPAL